MKRPLRIFTCLIFDTGPSLWHRQFPDTLRAMGHDVVETDQIGLTQSWELAANGRWGKNDRVTLMSRILERFECEHRRKPFDLFFAYLYPFQTDASLFEEVRSRGVPSAYFFCDNLSHPEVAKKIAPQATINWVPEKAALPQFELAKAAAIYLPMAANPSHNWPVVVEEDLQVSFAGGKNPFRCAILGEAITLGLPVTIYGGGWRVGQNSHHVMNSGALGLALHQLTRWQKTTRWTGYKVNAAWRFLRHGLGPRRAAMAYAALGEVYEAKVKMHVSCEALDLIELNALYGRSAVSIGINDQFCATANPPLYAYAKMREFEATMAGACYLTQLTDETEDLFVVGAEIECYSDAIELAAKAKELLASPTRRKEMRRAARARAIRDHAWQHRFEVLFRKLGL